MKMRKKYLMLVLPMCAFLLMGCTDKTPQNPTQNSINNENTDPNSGSPDSSNQTNTESSDGNTTGSDSTDPNTDGNPGDGTDSDSTTGSDDKPFGNPSEFTGDYVEEGGNVAFVTGVSKINDESYNEAVYSGIQTYATGAGVTYSYYTAPSDTPESYRETMLKALSDDCKLIVSAGPHYDEIVGELQNEYAGVSFLMIDGLPTDSEYSPIDIAPNVHCIAFEEHESGYLAGYMSVLDGKRKFGFIGGEPLDTVIRFCYGYIQGINDAANTLGVTKDINVNYWYSYTFLPNETITATAEDWYSHGTEVIFCCGGALYQSVIPAAEEASAWIIGVDINQNSISDRVLTSAMKGVDRAVINALDSYFAYDGWSKELSGQIDHYGVNERCSALPIDIWRFENASLSDYNKLYGQLKNGEITVDSSITDFPETNIKVTQYK